MPFLWSRNLICLNLQSRIYHLKENQFCLPLRVTQNFILLTFLAFASYLFVSWACHCIHLFTQPKWTNIFDCLKSTHAFKFNLAYLFKFSHSYLYLSVSTAFILQDKIFRSYNHAYKVKIIFKYTYRLKYQLVIFITNVTFVLTVKIYFKLLYIPFHPNIFCLKSISCLISVLQNAVHATIK